MSDGGLRALFRKHLSDIFWQAVETGGVGRGVPDSYYCGRRIDGAGRMGWVEFKATPTTRIKFELGQVAWHDRHARSGGTSFIAVRRQHEGGPRLGPPVDEFYLFASDRVVELDRVGLLAPTPTLHFVGGVRRWEWSQVGQVLLR